MRKSIIVVLFIVITLFSFSSSFVHAEGELNDSIKEKSNQILERDVNIPSNLEIAARFIFGISNNNPVSLSELVVLICLWLVVFIVIINLIVFVPLFGRGWKTNLAAIAITLLIAYSGAIRDSTAYILGFGGFLSFVDSWGIFNLIFIVLFILIFAIGASMLLKILRNKTDQLANEQSGIQVGRNSGLIKSLMEVFNNPN